MSFWTSLTLCCQEVEWIETRVRSLAPVMDRVVVIEGASRGDFMGKGDGRRLTGGNISSTDGTVEKLKQLAAEIPNLRVVFPPARGWKGKTPQINAGLVHAQPGFIFQFDVDEFWWPWQIDIIKSIMESEDYTEASFYCRHYWGDRANHMRLSRAVWGNQIEWRRVWRWNDGSRFASHEPPRLNRKHEYLWDMEETRALGLVFDHFSYSDIGQLRKKSAFYDVDMVPTILQWRKDPQSVPKNADLVPFVGVHPVTLPIVD